MIQFLGKTKEKKRRKTSPRPRPLTVREYRNRVTERLREIVPILQKVATGDFSQKVAIPEKGDEFAGLLAVLSLMIDKLQEFDEEKKKRVKGVEKMAAEKIRELKDTVNESSKTWKAIMNVAEDAEEERRRTKREKDKINTILYSLGEGVFVVDDNLKVNIINEAAAKMAGYGIKEILGVKFAKKLKFITEDTGEINDQFVRKAIATKTIQNMSDHTVLVDKAGNKIPVANSATPLLDKDGKVTGCVVVFRDVTHERAVSKAKTEFVSLASHQLRTPLSAIKWYTEMLLDGDAGKINEEQKKFLEEIYHSGSRMVELVNTMLNVSRLELGTFIIELKPTRLPDIAESVINELKVMIKSKGLRLKKKYDPRCPVAYVDPKLLRIIIQNLLSNAVKYTPRGGAVTLEIMSQKSNLLIKVADTGGGIPMHAIPHIFTRFFRADNAKEMDPEGTGLGLFIVKTIVDHAGCKIWFTSEEKKGTTFYLAIPLQGMKKKAGVKELI